MAEFIDPKDIDELLNPPDDSESVGSAADKEEPPKGRRFSNSYNPFRYIFPYNSPRTPARKIVCDPSFDYHPKPGEVVVRTVKNHYKYVLYLRNLKK